VPLVEFGPLLWPALRAMALVAHAHRLLYRRIGISRCKNSLCEWCAVGLMRPTVSRA
jgi:hypothetical protein